jgi:hypothetical protein
LYCLPRQEGSLTVLDRTAAAITAESWTG